MCSGSRVWRDHRLIYELVKNHKDWFLHFETISTLGYDETNAMCYFFANELKSGDLEVAKHFFRLDDCISESNFHSIMQAVQMKMSKEQLFDFLISVSKKRLLVHFFDHDYKKHALMMDAIEYFRSAGVEKICAVLKSFGRMMLEQPLVDLIEGVAKDKTEEVKLQIFEVFLGSGKAPQIPTLVRMEEYTLDRNPGFVFERTKRFAHNYHSVLHLFQRCNRITFQILENLDQGYMVKNPYLMNSILEIDNISMKMHNSYRPYLFNRVRPTLALGLIKEIMHPKNSHAFTLEGKNIMLRRQTGHSSVFHGFPEVSLANLF